MTESYQTRTKRIFFCFPHQNNSFSSTLNDLFSKLNDFYFFKAKVSENKSTQACGKTIKKPWDSLNVQKYSRPRITQKPTVSSQKSKNIQIIKVQIYICIQHLR